MTWAEQTIEMERKGKDNWNMDNREAFHYIE